MGPIADLLNPYLGWEAILGIWVLTGFQVILTCFMLKLTNFMPQSSSVVVYNFEIFSVNWQSCAAITETNIVTFIPQTFYLLTVDPCSVPLTCCPGLVFSGNFLQMKSFNMHVCIWLFFQVCPHWGWCSSSIAELYSIVNYYIFLTRQVVDTWITFS